MENMNKEELLKQLQRFNFAIIELALYLDTHPDCPCGLKAYQDYKLSFQEILSIYETKYGPITIYNMENEDYWTWSQGPWPWQKECE